MGTTSSLTQEVQQVLRELIAARDDARVRAHLLSLEARQRLSDLDQEIENLERKLSARGEWLAEHVVASARGLTRAVSDLMGPTAKSEPVKVREAMTTEVKTCRPSDSLSVAAQAMWEGDCGAVPVVDHDGRLQGMLTDRDICMAAFTRGVALHELTVDGTMTTRLHSCRADDSLQAVMDLMTKEQIRRVPVVSADQKLVGIVSLADIARLAQSPSVVSHQARAWVPSVLAGISEPPPRDKLS